MVDDLFTFYIPRSINLFTVNMFWSKSQTKENADTAAESAPSEQSHQESDKEPRSTNEAPQDLSSAAKEVPAPEGEAQAASDPSNTGSNYDWRDRVNTAKQLYTTANQVYTVASAIPQAKAALDPYLAKDSTTDEQPGAEATAKTADHATEESVESAPVPAGESSDSKKEPSKEVETSFANAEEKTQVEPQPEKVEAAPSSEPASAKDTTETDARIKPTTDGEGTKTSEPDSGSGLKDGASDATTKSSEPAKDETDLESKGVNAAEATAGGDTHSERAEADDIPVSKDTEIEQNDLAAEDKALETAEEDQHTEPEDQSKSIKPNLEQSPSDEVTPEETTADDEVPTTDTALAGEDEASDSSAKKLDKEQLSEDTSGPTDTAAPEEPHAQVGDEAPRTTGDGAEAEETSQFEPVELVDKEANETSEESPAEEISKEDKTGSEDPGAKAVDKEPKSELTSKPEENLPSDPASQPKAEKDSAPTGEHTDIAKPDDRPDAADSKPTSDSEDAPTAKSSENDTPAGDAPHEQVPEPLPDNPLPDTKDSSEPAKADSNDTESKPAEDSAAAPPEAQEGKHQPSKDEIEKAADAAKAAARLQSTADALWDQARAVRDPAERERLWRAAYNKEIEAHGQSKKARAMASGWGQGALSGVGISAALGIGLGNVVGALLGGVVSLPGSLVGAGVGAMTGPLVKLGMVKPGPEKKKEKGEKEFEWEEDLSDDDEHQRIVEAIRMDEKAAEGKA